MNKFYRVTHALNNTVYAEKELDGATPLDYVRSLGLPTGDDFMLPTVCAMVKPGQDPVYLLRDEWNDPLPEGASIYFITTPREPATIISVITLVISLVAGIYASRFNGSKKPVAPLKQALEEKRPTYQFDDQQNDVRVGQPLPIQYGRIRSYPDVASRSYTEYDQSPTPTDDEFLYLYLMIGVGEYDVEVVQIDDTPISNFTDVTYNLIGPADTESLFTTVVETAVEISDLELTSTNQGPFKAAVAGFNANRLDFDVVFPQGLFEDNGTATATVTVIFDARLINDEGEPQSAWTEVVNEVITENQTSPVRRTFTYNVPAGQEGRYEVRGRRIGDTTVDVNDSDKADWANMRSYSADGHPDYGDRTMLEIRIKATDQLNGSNLGRVNVISTRKLNIWNGASFDFGVTKNPVWAFYDLLTSTDYGIGLDGTQRADIDDLYTLAQRFDDEGYECNLRIDNSMSGMDALAQIAQAARCQVYQRGGRVYITRDEDKTAITGFYTRENIVKDSLSITWQPPSILSPNHFRITYFDEETWQEEQVICALADTTLGIPEDVRLWSITNRRKAWAEGRFLTAQDRYRRKIIEFETDIEGYLPNLLDKISVSDDSLLDFSSGIVEDFDGNSFFLSEPPDFAGQNYGYIGFKGPDGALQGPFVCIPGSTAYKVDVVGFDDVEFPIRTQRSQPDGDPTYFTFGLESPAQLCTVLEVSPAGQGRVRIKAVNHDERVHTADEGNPPPRGLPFLIT